MKAEFKIEKMALRDSFRYLNQYDLHKKIINEYVLRKPGDTKLLQRDTSKDKRDIDVLRENHRFLWENDEKELTWEQQFARKYYDRLFKEYCLCDLSRYKENKVALRWRIEKEVVIGKGQFICANKVCSEDTKLRTWEVNFAYVEQEERKNALVKIRLCPECSMKLNYHTKKRELRRKQRKMKYNNVQCGEVASSPKSRPSAQHSSDEPSGACEERKTDQINDAESDPWTTVKPIEQKTRDEEMEEYLDDLLL